MTAGVSAQNRKAGAQLEPATGGRQLILDTAARLFSAEGFSGVSLRDIARECGMKAASLYYHFPSKEALVVEVLRIGVERVFDEVRRKVTALPSDVDAETLLKTACRAHLSALLELHDYTAANVRIFSQVPESVRGLVLTLRDDYEAYWTALLARCGARGRFDPDRNLHLARLFILGAMNSSVDWFHPGARSIDCIAEELAAIFLQGLMRGPVGAAAVSK